jgi:hypothetical protein
MFRTLAALFLGAGAWISLFEAPTVRRPARLVPTNVRGINTKKNEDDPFSYASRDGKVHRFYYTSDAPGRPTLYMAEPNKKGEWQPGKALQGPDSEAPNISPYLTADGHDLYYATRIAARDPNKDAAAGESWDIVHSIHLDKGLQFTGPTPLELISTAADEMHPWLTADGKQLYFSRKTSDGWRVCLAERAEQAGAFGEPRVVSELSPNYYHATLTRDGMTMFLQGPLDNNRSGLFRSKRSRTVDGKWTPWSVPPDALEVLNAPPEEAREGDMSPSLSGDDRRLYFVSDRREGEGGRDIWFIGTANVISGVWKKRS